MRKIFHLKGEVAFSGGEPAGGVFIAIVDADPEYDDLLGIGVTNDAGGYRLSFTQEAFNQELGEAEEHPDLYVVASIEAGDARVPVLRRDFPGLRFDREEDLGKITLPIARGERPNAEIGLRAMPGASKIVKRTQLDPEIVDLAAREVAPIVEHLTGWRGLVDAARFEILDGFAEMQARRMARLLGKSELSDAERAAAEHRAVGCDVSTFALWDSHDRVVYVNRTILEAQNLDALRVTLGHELVHVGQSKAHPELDAELATMQAENLAHALAGTEPTKERFAAQTQFMANIEGYASYIESYLTGVYTHAATIWGAKLVARARMARRATRPVLTPATMPTLRELLELGATTKESQYEAGHHAYRTRAGGGDTAKFDPALRPELRFDATTLGVVEAGAKTGHVVSQFELGVLYAEGRGGVTKDLELAKLWFRRAAESGLAAAAHVLAAHLDKEDPERMRWFRVAAEQGYAPGQRSLGLALLPTDAAEAITWLEKAAGQGDADAMRDLASIFENGVGVPRDIVKGRVWMKRASRVST